MAHALVTGSSSGIGKAVAWRLLGDGWRVTGLDRAAPAIEHAAFASRTLDLTDADATERVATELRDVQALVHAAGVLRVGSAGQWRADDAALMWQLHVAAASRLAHAVLPRMAEAGFGRIVLIGSRAAHGMAGRGQYGASKAALLALARSWAAEVVSRGVTVNVVSPAATDTAMLADPARAAAQPKLPPIGRLIRADEVAAAVAFLLSDAAAPITGQELSLCGGASLPR